MSKNMEKSSQLRVIWDEVQFNEKVTALFSDSHSHEISSVIEKFDPKEIARILLAIDFPKNVLVFEEFDEEDKKDILMHFDNRDRAHFIEEMSPDERVDLIRILPEDVKDNIYRLIAQAERNDIKKLLEYKEGSVGAILTTEYVSLPKQITVREALKHLRRVAPDRETIYYVYVVDELNHLIGFVSLKKIILSSLTIIIEDIMDRDVVSVLVYDDKSMASKIISDYDLLALPVVDDYGKLVGIVTVDDAVDVVIEENTEDMLHYGGVEKHVNYLRASPLVIARQRVIWLFVLVGMGFISGYILERYADILDLVVSLVFFVPLLCSSGGNAGTQTSTMIIRALATEEIEMSDIWRVFFKEILAGLFMGLAMALFSSIRAFFVSNSDIRLSIVVGGAMLLVVVSANAMGALFPIILKKFKLDPALMCWPFIASIVDIFCIFSYFELAHYIYHIT